MGKYFIKLSVQSCLKILIGIAACVIISTKLMQYQKRMNSLESKLKTLEYEQKRNNREAFAKRSARNKRQLKENGPLEVEATSSNSGAAYTHWGRMDCRNPSQLVYSGFAAGSYFAHLGSGGNYICIHNNVTYPHGKYVEGHQSGAYIYGVEWRESTWSEALFDYSDIQGNSMYLQSLSCSVCITPRKTSNIMIPGRETCPPGWAVEYAGYIMSGRHDDKHSSEYICVDQKPMPVLGTEGQQHGAYIALVEPECGYSLPCEPIVKHRELRCVVCSI